MTGLTFTVKATDGLARTGRLLEQFDMEGQP